MQKKTLRAIFIIIVLVLFAYQTLAEEEKSETAAPAAALTTVVQEEVNVEPPTSEPTVAEEAETDTEVATTVPEEMLTLEEADGDFDYWVMALSWSPDYCASNDYNDAQQCSIGKQLDFVLHGLWPQYDNGYPSYCSDEELSYDLISEYAGLYPNDNLFDHEWEKHGTCTGLTPEGYLEWSEALKEGLIIPVAFDSPLEPFRSDAQSLQEAFIEVNPTFSENSFGVYCSGSGRFLKEIFVCYEKDGEPTECSRDVLNKASKSCGQADFLVRNTR